MVHIVGRQASVLTSCGAHLHPIIRHCLKRVMCEHPLYPKQISHVCSVSSIWCTCLLHIDAICDIFVYILTGIFHGTIHADIRSIRFCSIAHPIHRLRIFALYKIERLLYLLDVVAAPMAHVDHIRAIKLIFLEREKALGKIHAPHAKPYSPK